MDRFLKDGSMQKIDKYFGILFTTFALLLLVLDNVMNTTQRYFLIFTIKHIEVLIRISPIHPQVLID